MITTGRPLAVVIPFFQREPGILRRALASVNAQVGTTDVRVLVVDDDSPVCADDEVRALPGGNRFPIRVIKQPNGGPGSARNKGLESLPEDTHYVAFLDSDDTWAPTHLSSAILALERGYDVYFADLMQLNASTSAFRRSGRIRIEDHPVIDAGGSRRAYQGNMFEQVLTGNVIGTPTVVYNFQNFPGIRFRTEFQHAGEDYLFWLELAAAGATFSFSTDVECVCGRGVNVYSGSGWGTEASLRCIADEVRYRKAIRARFSLTPSLDGHLQARIASLRVSFVQDILHRLAHRLPISFSEVLDYLKLDPKMWLLFMPLTMRLIVSRKIASNR